MLVLQQPVLRLILSRSGVALSHDSELASTSYLIWFRHPHSRHDAPTLDTAQAEVTSLARVARRDLLVAAGNQEAVLVSAAFLPPMSRYCRGHPAVCGARGEFCSLSMVCYYTVLVGGILCREVVGACEG